MGRARSPPVDAVSLARKYVSTETGTTPMPAPGIHNAPGMPGCAAGIQGAPGARCSGRCGAFETSMTTAPVPSSLRTCFASTTVAPWSVAGVGAFTSPVQYPAGSATEPAERSALAAPVAVASAAGVAAARATPAVPLTAGVPTALAPAAGSHIAPAATAP